MENSFIIEKTKELIAAPTCCAEAKAAAEAYLAAVSTGREDDAKKAYLTELGEDLETIDELLEFAHSALCVQLFGEERAKGFIAHAEQLKADGVPYCDCPACSAAEAILRAEGLI